MASLGSTNPRQLIQRLEQHRITDTRGQFATPVRGLERRTRHVELLAFAQEIVELGEKQLSRGRREKGMDGAAESLNHSRTVVLKGESYLRLCKRLNETGAVEIALCLGNLRFTLAVDAESRRQDDIALSPVARERGEIVRGDRGDRFAAVVGRRLEPAVGRTLEIENRTTRYVHVVD